MSQPDTPSTTIQPDGQGDPASTSSLHAFDKIDTFHLHTNYITVRRQLVQLESNHPLHEPTDDEMLPDPMVPYKMKVMNEKGERVTGLAFNIFHDESLPTVFSKSNVSSSSPAAGAPPATSRPQQPSLEPQTEQSSSSDTPMSNNDPQPPATLENQDPRTTAAAEQILNMEHDNYIIFEQPPRVSLRTRIQLLVLMILSLVVWTFGFFIEPIFFSHLFRFTFPDLVFPIIMLLLHLVTLGVTIFSLIQYHISPYLSSLVITSTMCQVVFVGSQPIFYVWPILMVLLLLTFYLAYNIRSKHMYTWFSSASLN